MQLTEKDTAIITQVAFKGAVEIQTAPLATDEGRAEFIANSEFLKDVLFGLIGGNTPAPVTPALPRQEPQEPSNVIQASFPATTYISPVTVRGDQHGELPTWLIDQATALGVTEVWDNRDKLAEAKQKGKNWPWFKAVAADGDGKAFWPPKAA